MRPTIFFKFIIFSILILCFDYQAFAQVPESMNYQAVIRDGSGNVLFNQTVSLRIKILQGSANGSPVYVETFAPTTNAYGSIAIQIGTGTVITGTFNTIDWGANSYFVETAVDISGWSNYTVISTTQLMSVPYALYAKTAGNVVWSELSGNAYRTSGNIGIGTANPEWNLDVKSSSTTEGGVMQLSNSNEDHLFRIFTGSNSDPNPFLLWKTGDPLRFSTSSGLNDGSWQEHMRINSNGNVGIGTTSPSANLEVSGTTRITDLAGSGDRMVVADADGDLSTQAIPSGNDGNSTAWVASPQVVTSGGGRIWMDRNLGASQVATSTTDAAAYGDLFQWGRYVDGHEDPNSNTTSTLGSNSNPSHGDYITTSADWLATPNVNLWQGVDGVNNVCPTGFRLPTKAEWETEIASWSSSNAAGAFASPLKLTLAPYRSNYDGSTTGQNNGYGMYWSSTVSGSSTERLRFTPTAATVSVSHRGAGHSVRCIKDDGATGPTGPAGADGATGPTGPTGPAGPAGADATNYWTESGSNVYRSSGNVGIGTTSPTAKLEVSGTARITDLAGTGDRMVVADADGDLSTQAIPSGGSSMPNGSNNGDMLYWDGSAWQTIAVGSAGAVLQIIGGVPTWVSSPDITGPTITLNGNANMNVIVGGSFTDPGASTDEGTLTTSGTVDVTTAGTYTITYTSTDATGNTATATRTVAVYQSQYNYTGSAQTFTVPAGVTSISVDAYGANGESTQSGYCGGTEGKGGRVQADLTVTPGEVLNIYVGGSHYWTGSGSGTPGYNGGGSGKRGGGGATDIRIGGTALTDRVLVAGGGGGAYGCGGELADGCDGGGLTGETGNRTNSGAYGGTGGTQSAAGTGGASPDFPAEAGSAGSGANGGSGGGPRGSGGGGGYYGGGGGASGSGWGWGGGGGGSSYTHPTLCSSVIHTQGAQAVSLSVAVHGSLTITIP